MSAIFSSSFPSVRRSKALWGRLAACGGLIARQSAPAKRRPLADCQSAVGFQAALKVFLLLLALTASAAVVDRVAVVVGNKIITESEVLQDLRITQFLNQQLLDLSPAKRREAADKMVDQQLLRNEMETARFAMPDTEQADAMLANFRRQHFANDDAFHAALARYGVTEAEVKQRQFWQLAVIQFTHVRFRSELPLPPALNIQTANRMRAGVAPPQERSGESVDQVMEQWLKQQRSSTRVVV
jgi:hypothetical protein